MRRVKVEGGLGGLGALLLEHHRVAVGRHFVIARLVAAGETDPGHGQTLEVGALGLRQREPAGPSGEALDQTGEIRRAQVLRPIVRRFGVGDVLAEHRLALGEPAHASRISWNRAAWVGNMRRDHPGRSSAAHDGAMHGGRR
jgi:hypothetical protein